MKHLLLPPLLFLSAVVPLAGCDDDEPEASLAPESDPLVVNAPPPESLPEGAVTVSARTEDSQVSFLMEAPLEHIKGEAPASVSGDLHLSLEDLTRSTGLIKVDLLRLEIFQTRRQSETGEFGELKKNEKQNHHMRTWFQISEDAPKDVRESNRWAEFRIDEVSKVSTTDVTSMTGPERTVTAEVAGDLRLHGRTARKIVPVELTFHFDGDTFQKVEARTREPVPVGLAEHDVRPRSAFDKLAQKTLAALGEKVATHAPVHIALTAVPSGR